MRLCAWAGLLELTLGAIGWSALLAVAVEEERSHGTARTE